MKCKWYFTEWFGQIITNAQQEFEFKQQELKVWENYYCICKIESVLSEKFSWCLIKLPES